MEFQHQRKVSTLDLRFLLVHCDCVRELLVRDVGGSVDPWTGPVSMPLRSRNVSSEIAGNFPRLPRPSSAHPTYEERQRSIHSMQAALAYATAMSSNAGLTQRQIREGRATVSAGRTRPRSASFSLPPWAVNAR